MKKTIFAAIVIIVMVFVVLTGCGSGVEGSIEGIWIDSDLIVELTLAESDFMIVRRDSGVVIEGTYLISDDEIKFVTEYVDGIASSGEQTHSFSFINDTIIIDDMEILTRIE